MSYPALYTHNKIKHSKANGGKPLSVSNGRGRGRPRKNSIKKFPADTTDYLQTEDKRGGPSDPVVAFETAFINTFPDKDHESHPLYEYINNFSPSSQSKGGKTKEQYSALSDEERMELKCDEVFALFIGTMCQKTNKHFSSILCSFILLYREVANKHCWKYKDDSKGKSDEKESRGVFSET